MDNLVKPLFITPLVYQRGNINALINSAFIDSLPSNYAPTVLCQDANCVKERCMILNVQDNILVRTFLRFKLKFLGKNTGFLPDSFYYIWYKKALDVADMYLRENKVDYIHSISFPYTSHLVALELKRKYGIPWIAHFYEPWGDNPYRKKNSLVISKNEVWEDEVVRAADVILHNSDMMCQSWSERYGSDISNKLFSLPMSFAFKRQCLSTPEYDPQFKLQIAHVGNFYGKRKAEPFLKALSALVEEKPHFREKLKVFFVGEMLRDDLEFIKNQKLGDIIEIVGRKSEEECVEYYQRSNVFLVIEGEDQGLLFFPSKLIQYYFYNRPIVGLTQKNSVLWNELLSSGHKAFHPNDCLGIKNYLESALLNYNSLLNYCQNSWKRFDPKNVAEKYVDILNKYILTYD